MTLEDLRDGDRFTQNGFEARVVGVTSKSVHIKWDDEPNIFLYHFASDLDQSFCSAWTLVERNPYDLGEVP